MLNAKMCPGKTPEKERAQVAEREDGVSKDSKREDPATRG